ncbi:hypothetical protein [Paramagnetospirillum kuznetsovii]|uniref:hypothetical protein n=1 Tax=Paramagnetospirillum kuznetsovii TaxID=2053833 RepID=UPI001EFDB46B|nr:hypothetical protein [Paramagnetospirillum kuznetsovii]
MGNRAPQENAVQSSAEQASDAIVDDNFTLALEAMLSEDEARFQTKLQVISLVEFREAVGSKWHRLSEKVMMIAEGVINLHIGHGNVYGRRGQDLFVLLFRNVPDAEGRRRAVLIAQELGTRLVGAQFVGNERPLALAAELTIEVALAPHGVLNLDAIHDAIGEVRAIMAPVTDRAGYRPHLTTAVEADAPIRHSMLPTPLPEQQDLRAHLHSTKLSARDFTPRRSMLPGSSLTEKSAPQMVAAPSWTAVEISGGKPSGPRPGVDAAPPMPGDAALSLAWRPTWLAADETIGAYKAHVQRVDQPGETPWEGCRAYPSGGGEAALALDRFTIGAAVRELRSPDASRSAAKAILPIHWSSVTSPQRMSVLSPLADLSEDVRANRLIIDLFGTPDGVVDAQLSAALQSLRPLCREVSLRVRLSMPQAGRAALCGIRTIGVDLAELTEDERTDDANLLQSLRRLRQDAGAAGLSVYAWGIRRRTVVAGVVGGDFAMISGPGLMKDLPRPAKILPAPKSRIAGPVP